MSDTVCSRHYFRRTAREAAERRRESEREKRRFGDPIGGPLGGWVYKVERGRRGPFAWVVRRYPAS